MWIGAVWIVTVLPSALAQRASTSSLPGQGAGIGGSSSVLPFVNSAGLRLRDFPSTGEGTILAVLDKGQRLEISAVTEWRVRIGGGAFPWYYVSVAGTNGASGWVYGEYVSFEPGYPLDTQTVRIVSRRQMNRSLLVLQIFRRLLGTDTPQVATSWLRGLRGASSSPPPIAFPTEYSLRSYTTDFGEVVVRFHPRDTHQLVLSVTLDRPVTGLLVMVGDSVVQVQELLGTNYYSQGNTLFYRGIPGIGSYAVTFQIENGVVTTINASALVN